MASDPRAVFLDAARAGAERFAPRGLEYLFAVIAHLAGRPVPAADGAVPAGTRPHVGPADLCRTFRDRASADFGGLASHVLSRWGLPSGAALGEAVRLLSAKGCLKVEDGEAWEEYDAAGTFRFP